MIDDTTKLSLTWVDYIQNRLTELKKSLAFEFCILDERLARYRIYYNQTSLADDTKADIIYLTSYAYSLLKAAINRLN